MCIRDRMQAMAEEEAAVSYSKYYTSIRLEEGDTLWKLAERYNNHSEKKMCIRDRFMGAE